MGKRLWLKLFAQRNCRGKVKRNMKFLFALSGVVIIFILVVFSLGSWLDYDQMLGCSATPTASGDCEKADVIVAISGGDTSVRTAKTVELYKDGFADNLIFSGAAADPSSPSNANVMAVEAGEAGGTAEGKIIDGSCGKNNAKGAKFGEILREHGWAAVGCLGEN